jgi:DNA-binding response OmpR family regulator
VVPCVLIVEDERKIRQLLRSYLEHDGLAVMTTGSGADALQTVRDCDPDLVLLDLCLPDVSGEEVAHELRRTSDVPIIMLTAKTDVDDRIKGLRLGADDYVTKPFSPREVVLRVQAVLRRGRGPQATGQSYGNRQLVIDQVTRAVTASGHPVDLTPSEWDLLTTLAGVPGRVFTRAELVNRIRDYEFDGYERIIDTHVKNLRRKLEPDPTHPEVIETVLGAGYRLSLSRDPRDPRDPENALTDRRTPDRTDGHP